MSSNICILADTWHTAVAVGETTANGTLVVAALLALAIVATISIAPYVAAARKLRPLLFVSLIVSLWAGDKPGPVVIVKDIEIKSCECDHTGCRLTWACGTNIVLGVDKFIIQRSTRQIPARTGWSPFEDYGESMTTNWMTMAPQHASDTKWKVITRKEAN